MRTLYRILALAVLAPALAALPGCKMPLRICTGCTYKMVTFTAVPTGQVESASVKAQVKHIGACPQSSFPNDCTESLSYSVKCAVTPGSVTLPLLIDAADTNPNRTAKLSVKVVGNPTPAVLTGVVGTAPGTTTLPATPCPLPKVDPYETLPDVL